MTRLKIALLSSMVMATLIGQASAATHPVLISQSRISALAAGGSEWNTLKSFCDDNLNSLIGPEYAGWGWRTAVENYSTAYQVLRTSNPTTANAYAQKALALMKVLARHHNYGGPAPTAQLLGQGNGTNRTFTLPFAPKAGTTVSVYKVPVVDTAITYAGTTVNLSHFDPIVKISNTSGGAASYAATDYKLFYRDGLSIYVLKWLTATHPAANAAYYVTMTSGEGATLTSSQYTVSGTTLTLTAAPTAAEAIFVSCLGADYEQTGNYLGGMSSVTPDGPGYQMRTFNPGLAFGFDLLFDYTGLTTQLKTEFVDVLNQQIDWFKTYGYENEGDLGNYFIRGLLTGTMFTAYGTDGANSRTTELKTLADTYIQRPFTKLDEKIPGGFGPQGQYANGVAIDVMQVFLSIYKDLTGQDLLSQLEWTSSIIPATIHGTKPDRVTFYDGGDWSELPATPLTGLVDAFLTYLPDHPMAPYGRQLLSDIGSAVPAGTRADYKTDFPPAYFAKVSGPVYARSDWGTGAVWASLSAGEIFMDHQHNDAGSVTIQRGADYLLCDAGGYGDGATLFHNTLLFDDRGAGDISTYPPGQGSWGFESVSIGRFEQAANYVYGLADFTRSYAAAHDGLRNSVKMAVRSMVFVRPDIVIVHDRAQTSNANVKKYVNWNFPATPTSAGGISTVTFGSSKLFMKPLVPANATPVITAITNQPIGKSNYQVMVSGQQNDNFLHVFEATPSSQSAMQAVTLVNGTLVNGAEVALVDTVWVATFAKTDTALAGPFSYTYSVTGPHHDLIADLQKSMQYRVTVTSHGQKLIDNQTYSSSKSGTISVAYSATDSGTVTLTSTGVPASANRPLPEIAHKSAMVRLVNNVALISLQLDQPQNVSIELYDLGGKLVSPRYSEFLSAGVHSIQLDASSRLSGKTCLIRTRIGSSTITGKYTLVR